MVSTWPRAVYSIALLSIVILVCIASCDDNAADSYGTFDIYGRVVYRTPLVGSSAEFFLFHNGEAVTDAFIMVDTDTIPLIDSSGGYYNHPLQVDIGDTLEYSIVSEYGSSSGVLIIPDSVTIVRPTGFDTLLFGADISAIWKKGAGADGYFAYLENQDGFVANVTETHFDTTAILAGDNFIYPGADRFWVEALKGSVSKGLTHHNRILPSGIVASAGNYVEVYIGIQTGSGEE